MDDRLEQLQSRLGYRFDDPALLRQALTHRSHGQSNNERLEFLGDSVLNCVVATLLYHRFEAIDEGDLSRLRANLVRQATLVEVAQRLELPQCLLLGEGEHKSGGSRRPSILGDTTEAVFGAVFLDGGFEAARAAIAAQYEPILRDVDPATLGKDAKTLLQEHLQSRKLPLPVYSVVATHGAAHNQLFEVECAIPKLKVQVLGSGGSRRAAEQVAARRALEQAQQAQPAPARRGRARIGTAASAALAAPAAAGDGGGGGDGGVAPGGRDGPREGPGSAEAGPGAGDAGRATADRAAADRATDPRDPARAA